MLTIACLYALTGVAWLWRTGRLANSDRAFAADPTSVRVRVGALLVVLVIWPLGILLARYRQAR